MTPKLSIILVNYRSADVLEGCLSSIYVATNESVEVILVDNSAGEEGADKVLKQSGHRGHYFPQAENIGYTRAAILGAAHAAGEFICFLNPDTLLERHALDRLIDWVRQHPRTVAGPREKNPADEIVTTAFPFVTRRYIFGANIFYNISWPTSWRPFLSWLVPSFRFSRMCRQAAEPIAVPVLSGACLVMPRAVWTEVGDWNQELTYFGLESEWFKRARELGVIAWYVPDAVTFHEHAVSIKRSGGGIVSQEANRNRHWHARQLGWLAIAGLALALWVERLIRRHPEE